MPELPDLQVFSKNLTKRLKGKKIGEVIVHEGKKLHASESELNEALKNKTLKKVYRVGKRLYFDFGKDALLSVHLMLHGKLVLSDDEKEKHALISLKFSDGRSLILTDYQKMANVSLNPESTDAVDALSDDLDAEWLREQLANSRAAIKTFLMDQKIIGGIGNAYADEILWHAKIAPQSAANKIPDREVAGLSTAIKDVLIRAEKELLESHPDIISGEYRDFLTVHGSRKKTSPTGAPVETARIGGRKTYFTKEQKLYR